VEYRPDYPLGRVRLRGVRSSLYVSNTVAGHKLAKNFRHKLLAVVRVYELRDPILKENFGLQEFDDFCSYCMSHWLQPDKLGEMV